MVFHLSSQENMSRMLLVTDVQDIIKRHQAQIITSLKDPDIRYLRPYIFCDCIDITLATNGLGIIWAKKHNLD